MPELFIWIYVAGFAAAFIFASVHKINRALNGEKVKAGLIGQFVSSALWPVVIPAVIISLIVIAVKIARHDNAEEMLANIRKANNDA